MSQIIFTFRYLKSESQKAKTKRKNYTKYIATCESVEKCEKNDTKTEKLSTKKQNELIKELLSEFPSAKKTLGYEDYSMDPTSENASELI